MNRTRALVSCAALLLALAGCGDDGAPSGGPSEATSPSSPASESSTSAAVDLCAAVSDQQLSDLAGRPMAAGTQAAENGVTECTGISDDGSIVVTWQTQDAAGSLDAEVDRADADGLDRSSVTVGTEPGALLAGTRTGSRNAKVVAVLGDESLYVDVSWLRGVGPSASLDTLSELALGVADQVAS